MAVVISTTIGTVNYNFAKKQLIESGKLDLQHLTNTSIATLETLNQAVEEGTLSEDEAKNQAREILNGPKVDNGKLIYDYKQSPFVYKENGYLFGVDSSLDVVLNPVIPLGTDKTSEQGKVVRENLIQAAKATDEEKHFYTYEWKNAGEDKPREKIAYMTYFEPWDWSVGIGAYTDEFYESLKMMKWVTILLCLGITLISMLVFYFAIRNKLSILNQLYIASSQIANGHLNIDTLPESADELGHLGAAFNKMTVELRLMVQHLQELSMNLVDSANQLSAISEETAAGSEEVSRALIEITRGTVAQASETEETSDNIGLLTQSIENMNEQYWKLKEVTATSEQAAENGRKMVTILKKSNDEMLLSSEEISQDITSLHQKIHGIGKITETINGISEQTNLLALNASIEAARAGEHGKGFAVVAQEVRKLAEESNKQTIKIQEMITAIEQDAEKTVNAMSKTRGLSDRLNTVVGDTEAEFNQIGSKVFDAARAIENMNAEIDHIKGSSDGIHSAIQNISTVSQSAAAASEEITASVDEQTIAIANSTELAVKLNEVSEELNRTIQKYKL
ncbi:methyl-accepting chemotaxis protein [Solibacillus cecembensis]|uniref:methyl-accepting chemotaxis protein n=1 Tax=Solibacillus cecembensis TaxID=459347 RepID=UPI003D004DF7